MIFYGKSFPEHDYLNRKNFSGRLDLGKKFRVRKIFFPNILLALAMPPENLINIMSWNYSGNSETSQPGVPTRRGQSPNGPSGP